MTEQAKLKSDTVNETEASHVSREDVRAVRVQSLRNRISGLGALKITSVKEEKKKAPVFAEESTLSFDHDEEPVLVLKAANAQVSLTQMSAGFQALYAAGIIATAAWLAFCVAYGFQAGVSLAPQELGAFIAGMFAPPALFWLMVSSMHRRSDVQQYASALRGELHSLLFPSEETSGLINKDIERLCRQAAELSGASKAILKSIQRARQGLRVEIRDFSGVSKKAEFHIDRLAGSLNEKSLKLLTLTEEIEQRTAGIDEKAQAGAAAWDQATQNILGRAGEMEAALEKGSEKILLAADKARDKTKEIEDNLGKTYESLNEAVDQVAERLQGLSGRFKDHTLSLSDAADQVSEETSRLAEMIRSQIEGLEGVTDRTVEAMTRSTETIQHHKEALDRGAESVAEQSERIANSISGSVQNLSRTVDEVIGKTEGLETKIDEKTTALSNVIKGISKEADIIEEAGLHAANKLGEALSLAVAGSESISAAVRRAIESLEKSTHSAREQADSMMDSTRSHIEELNAAGEGNADHIRKVVSLLEESRKRIEDVSQTTRTHVDELTQAVDEQSDKINLSIMSLTERMESVRSSLQEPLKEIQSAVADADGRHQMIEDVLRRRVSDLNESSEKATASAETIRNMLRGQAQEIATLSGQIAGHARTINEQMTLQKDSLGTEIKDSLGMLEKVRGALDEQSSRLHQLSESAVDDISGLREEISTRCQEISEFTEKAFENLVNIDESLDSKITLLKERADQAAESVGAVNDKLLATANDIEPVYLRAIEQAETTHDRFEKLKSGFQSTTDSNLAKLQQIGIVFDTRLQSLQEGADQASIILRTSSDHLQSRAQEIESASKSAHEKMRDITASLADQSSDIHLITDQALLKIETIQKSIGEQFHELSASVGHAIAQLQNAGDEFGQQSRMVQSESEKARDGFDKAGSKAREESTRLNAAAQNAVDISGDLVARVQKEAQELLEKANESLFELKKAGDTFSIRAREMGEQMKASLRTSEAYGREIKHQAASVADVSVQSAERMSKAVSILTSTMDQVGHAANDVTVRVEKTRENLATESDRLLSVSSAALEAARDAAVTFTRQSESLFKASQDASHFAREIQNSSLRTQRESFMSSAKFIIESLHSLSVDMTRMLEGDLSEKTWKAFQKGDISAFTRKLVEMADKMPLEKARDKFAKDSEFRTYVLKFLRQFEEMYDQAVAGDHGALLSSTIGSSEVGKLYQFLCSVAGKESRLSRETLKAA